jgi:hypothetical protein
MFYLSFLLSSLSFAAFLHETDHENFTRNVDAIMNGIASKHADIEINYHKIPYDRQSNEKLKADGK